MEDKKSLATILGQYMDAADVGNARLASLVNKQVGIDGFLHRSTVRNWRNGTSKSVKDWRQLTAIASALELDETDTDQLLFSGGCPAIASLIKIANDEDGSFLSAWENMGDVDNTAEITHTETDEETYFPTDEQTSSLIVPSMPSLKEQEREIDFQRDTIEQPVLQTKSRKWQMAMLGALLLMAGLGAFRFMNRGANEPVTHPIFTEDVENRWDTTLKSWNASATNTATGLGIEGGEALKVTLEEYGGLSFFRPQPLSTVSYNFLQFHVRNDTTETMTLSILVDDDGDFDNGEVGRIVVNDYLEGDITQDAWQKVQIPLDDLSQEPFNLSQIVIHSPDKGDRPRFWLDQIELVTE